MFCLNEYRDCFFWNLRFLIELPRYINATPERPPAAPPALRLIPKFHRDGDMCGNRLPILGRGFVLVALQRVKRGRA